MCGVVVILLTLHQCDRGLIPQSVCANDIFTLYLKLRGFSPGTPVSSAPLSVCVVYVWSRRPSGNRNLVYFEGSISSWIK